MSLIDKRVAIKPIEYPRFIEFMEAMQKSYWTKDEYSYTEDVQDYHTKLAPYERNAIKNSMLAISQVELAAKVFWSNLYDWFPKPEVLDMGIAFSEAEVRHKWAYSHLLEVLGLNDEFDKIGEIPAIRDRIKFLDKHIVIPRDKDYRRFVRALVIVSLFTEHISLFSQFLIIKSFNKEKNLFKGMSNVISATRAEEQLHGQGGIYLVSLLREEFPEWFDEEFEATIVTACLKAWEAEQKMLDWILEEGELDFLPRKTIEEFIKDRFNTDLEAIGLEPIWEIDHEVLKQVEWFTVETIGTSQVDFFSKRPTSYSLRNKSITEDDLF